MQLDAICQEAGDMNVEEFMLVYNDICLEKKQEEYRERAEVEEGTYVEYATANPIQAEKARSWDELHDHLNFTRDFFLEDNINSMDMGQDD